MNRPPVIRDERYAVVENASFKIGYLILSFGMLLLISIRGLLLQETYWDFFALVILSSFAATLYQYRQRIITFSWKFAVYYLAITLLAAGIAAALVLLLR